MVILSRPLRARCRESTPRITPGFSSTGTLGSAGLDHFLGAVEELAISSPINGRRHHAEVRERGIAAADAGQAEEDVAEAVASATCCIFEPGSVMAMKRLPALSAPTVCFARSKKYCLKMLGSSVVPDLLETMNSVLRQIDFVLERLDLRRIGGVEHVKLGKAGDLAEGFFEDFGAKAGAAHAEQKDVGEAVRLYVRDGSACSLSL